MSEVNAPAAGTPAPVVTDPNATPAPVVTPDPKEKDQFAEKLQLLSQKERQIFREKQKIAHARKQTMDAMAKVKAWEESQANAKKNPLDYLTKGGLSYDELTQYMLNGGKPTEIDKVRELEDKFTKFQQQTEAEKKQAQEQAQLAQQQMNQQALDSFQEEIGEFIETNKSTYELISTRDAAEDVFTTIRDQYKITIQNWIKEGKPGRQPMPLTIKEASDLVEEFYEKEVERLNKTQKMQGKYKQVEQVAGQEKKAASPTLNNQMTTSSAASMLPAKNEADRMARALAKLGG